MNEPFNPALRVPPTYRQLYEAFRGGSLPPLPLPWALPPSQPWRQSDEPKIWPDVAAYLEDWFRR